MLSTHKFNKFCDASELSQAERAFAEKVWLAAEAACFGKSPEVARLLATEKEWVTQEAFTKQELQFMKSVFEKSLMMIERWKAELKDAVQQTWELSDKNNPETREAFAHHKKLRTVQQRIKRQSAALAKIQHKIKHLISK